MSETESTTPPPSSPTPSDDESIPLPDQKRALETLADTVDALRSEFETVVSEYAIAKETYAERHRQEHPDDPVLDLDAFPDPASFEAELSRLGRAFEQTKRELAYLDRVRERETERARLLRAKERWDESADGPFPTFPDPEPIKGIDDVRSEHERLMDAYANETERVRRELDVFRESGDLLTITKESMRKRAARARASGAIDPVGFYADLEAHFGDSVGLSPGNLMNVHARDDNGRTPLMCVVRCELGSSEPHPERLGRVNTLLGMGSNIDAKDDDGNTALAHAVAEPNGDSELVRLLVAHGADPFAKNSNGQTVLERAHAFALHPILFGTTGELRNRIARSLTSEQAKNMRVFVDDPQGAAELFRELLRRLG